MRNPCFVLAPQTNQAGSDHLKPLGAQNAGGVDSESGIWDKGFWIIF